VKPPVSPPNIVLIFEVGNGLSYDSMALAWVNREKPQLGPLFAIDKLI